MYLSYILITYLLPLNYAVAAWGRFYIISINTVLLFRLKTKDIWLI